MLVCNIFGGPGVGKSTLAATLFAELKRRNVRVEYVPEWIKWRFWEDNPAVVKDQILVFAQQNHQQYVLRDKVDVCIVDSPILQSLAYGTLCEQTNAIPGWDKFIRDTVDTYDNLNFWLTREHDYPDQERGRSQQSESHANEVDDLIRKTILDELPDIKHVGSMVDPIRIVSIIEERLLCQRIVI